MKNPEFGTIVRIGVTLLLVAGRAVSAEDTLRPFWQVAQARKPVPGAPQYSAVTVRNLRPHPCLSAKEPDPYDTLRMIQEFHVTRLEWTYQLDPPFVAQLKTLGLTVGGALEDDSGSASKLGRVTGKDGQLVTHRWFPRDRLVGCANAPEFRRAWLEEAKRNVDAGVDLIQQDDPQMAARCDPPYCYCQYCQQAFAAYRQKHGPLADYEQFQRDSILAFHQEMHRQLDAYAGRHIPFSHNSAIRFHGKPDWTNPAFDFINGELDARNLAPTTFCQAVTAANDIPLVFCFRDTAVLDNRRFLALTYATGTWMMLPWDVFMPGNAPRYFGSAADYADLSGFVRANAGYLDGYEAAATTAVGLPQGAAALAIEAGSGQAYAWVRARPGEPDAPVVIHLLEWAQTGQPFVLRVRTAGLGNRPLVAKLRVPVAYNEPTHAKAQATRDFSSLAQESVLPLTIAGGDATAHIPALHPWGIMVLEPR